MGFDERRRDIHRARRQIASDHRCARCAQRDAAAARTGLDVGAVAQHGDAIAQAEHFGQPVRHVEQRTPARLQLLAARRTGGPLRRRSATSWARRAPGCGTRRRARAPPAAAADTRPRASPPGRPGRWAGAARRGAPGSARACSPWRSRPKRSTISRPAKMLPGDRQIREAQHLLVDHADAALERVARAAEVKPFASPEDLARIGLNDAGENLEQRGLAGAVLAHERVRLPLGRPRTRRRAAPGRRRRTCGRFEMRGPAACISRCILRDQRASRSSLTMRAHLSGIGAPDMPTFLQCAACVIVAAAFVPRLTRQAPATARPTVTHSTSAVQVDDKPIEMFTLDQRPRRRDAGDDYGGIITSLKVPDRDGQLADVVLGFDTPQGYLVEPPPPFFGAIIGRYGNRIAKGKFTLDGHTYTLATNNGPNHLHGGNKGFDKVLWTTTPRESADGRRSCFTRTSPDGEEGYPGNLQVARHLHADRQERADRRLPRDDRQGDAGQPDAAQLLQPGGRGLRRHPRSPADDQRRPLHAGGSTR